MNLLSCAFVVLWLSSTAAADPAVERAPASAGDQGVGVSIVDIIGTVSRNTGKHYVLDPRVHAQVQLIGQDFDALTYGDLLTILRLCGFTAVESGGYVLVIPEESIRQMPLPQVRGNETFPDAQYVTRVVPVTHVPAATLVPILRPLLPQQSHMAAAVCSNSILLVDTFANIQRIESLIKTLDAYDVRQSYGKRSGQMSAGICDRGQSAGRQSPAETDSRR